MRLDGQGLETGLVQGGVAVEKLLQVLAYPPLAGLGEDAIQQRHGARVAAGQGVQGLQPSRIPVDLAPHPLLTVLTGQGQQYRPGLGQAQGVEPLPGKKTVQRLPLAGNGGHLLDGGTDQQQLRLVGKKPPQRVVVPLQPRQDQVEVIQEQDQPQPQTGGALEQIVRRRLPGGRCLVPLLQKGVDPRRRLFPPPPHQGIGQGIQTVEPEIGQVGDVVLLLGKGQGDPPLGQQPILLHRQGQPPQQGGLAHAAHADVEPGGRRHHRIMIADPVEGRRQQRLPGDVDPGQLLAAEQVGIVDRRGVERQVGIKTPDHGLRRCLITYPAKIAATTNAISQAGPLALKSNFSRIFRVILLCSAAMASAPNKKSILFYVASGH